MRHPLLLCGLLLFCPNFVQAQAAAPAAPKVVKETWDAAYVEGAKCGFVHTSVEEVEREGVKYYRTRQAMDLSIKRYGQVVPLRMEAATEETADGKITALRQTQILDMGKRFNQRGLVEKEELVVSADGVAKTRRVPWDDSAVGMYRQDQLFRTRKIKTGDAFTYKTFELSLLQTVQMRVVVGAEEEVDLLKEKKVGDKTGVDRVRVKLLRADATPDKIEVNGNAIPLPRLASWLDKEREVVRYQMDLPGLGAITFYRTSRAVAEQEGAAPALLPDLGLGTLIKLDKRIDRPHDARSVVYRVTVKGDDDVATAFVRDSRQQVSAVKGTTFELTARPGPSGSEADKEPGAEYRKSSYFLDSDDARVREIAAEAAGDETEPWRKAQRMEKWVHEHMHANSGVGFTTAGQIARDCEGDCRQHALLTAALCRAAGVPSRTAVGLVYVLDESRGPVLGFHMWTEVWARGRWRGLDATLGRGGVGPTHLKISDASWHNTETLAPLLPVTRVMGRISVEVLKVDGDDK